jgi:hypothetical protein
MAVEESTISVYIGNKTTALAKINAIQALIDAMELKALDVVNGIDSTVSEYWMDDGQMKVKTSYRGIADVTAGILALEKLKQKYINTYNGRGFVLRDVRGINR